jgi:hypothetical protein
MDKLRACKQIKKLAESSSLRLKKHLERELSELKSYVFFENDKQCGYKAAMTALGVFNKVLVIDSLSFKNDKLSKIELSNYSIDELFGSESLTGVEMADALINHIPWLAEGLDGDEGGWSYVSQYNWRFFISSDKEISITDISLK